MMNMRMRTVLFVAALFALAAFAEASGYKPPSYIVIKKTRVPKPIPTVTKVPNGKEIYVPHITKEKKRYHDEDGKDVHVTVIKKSSKKKYLPSYEKGTKVKYVPKVTIYKGQGHPPHYP